MERKWIGPNNYWEIYRFEKGSFFVSSSNFPAWQGCFWDNWTQIENMAKDLGLVEEIQPILKKREGIILQNVIGNYTPSSVPIPAGQYFYNPKWEYTGCQHEWAAYTGFIKVEIYCIKCKEVQE